MTYEVKKRAKKKLTNYSKSQGGKGLSITCYPHFNCHWTILSCGRVESSHVIYVLIYGSSERSATLVLFSTSPWFSFWCCSYSLNPCHCLATLVSHHADILLKFSLEHFFFNLGKIVLINCLTSTSSSVPDQLCDDMMREAVTWHCGGQTERRKDTRVGVVRGRANHPPPVVGEGNPSENRVGETTNAASTPGGRGGREMWLSGNTSVIKLPLISSSFRRLPLWV